MKTDVFGLTINYKSWGKKIVTTLYSLKRRDRFDIFFNLVCRAWHEFSWR